MFKLKKNKKVKIVYPKINIVYNKSNSIKIKNGTITNISSFIKHFKFTDMKYFMQDIPNISIIRILNAYDNFYVKAFLNNNYPVIIDSSNLDDEEFNIWIKKMENYFFELDLDFEYVGDNIFLIQPKYVKEKLLDEKNMPYELVGKTKIYYFDEIVRLKNKQS